MSLHLAFLVDVPRTPPATCEGPSRQSLPAHLFFASRQFEVLARGRPAVCPGSSAVALHGSIVTFPENASAVTAAMEVAYRSAGVRTTIKVTPFDEEAQETR